MTTATPMHTSQVLDWQTWVTFGLGLLALAYLVRRWWPRRTRSAGSCGTGGAGDTDSACGSCHGCGTGQGTPVRDHRSRDPMASLVPPAAEKNAVQPVHWHPRPPR